MKGRMRPYLPELTIRDYNTYMRYLRGVRRQMYKSYGFYACHLLRTNRGAVCHPVRQSGGAYAHLQTAADARHAVPAQHDVQTLGIRQAAQTEILMGWHNLQDRKYSELRPVKRLRPRSGQAAAAPRLRESPAGEPGTGAAVCAGAGAGGGADEPERQKLRPCRRAYEQRLRRFVLHAGYG